MKKSISLSFEEVKDIINYIDTSIVYLENTKCRFKILKMPYYFNAIDKGISQCFYLKEKFIKLSSKFENSDLQNIDDNMFDTFLKIITE